MKYRKKPVVIEAVRWNGKFNDPTEWPDWFRIAMQDGTLSVPDSDPERKILTISTLEGLMLAQSGDYVIRGVKGELYPCKPDIFDATYDPVN